MVLPETDLVTTLVKTPEYQLQNMPRQQLAALISGDRKIKDWNLPLSFFESVSEAACGGNAEKILIEFVTHYAIHLGRDLPKSAMFQRGTILNHHLQVRDAIEDPSFLYIYRDPRAAINSISSVAQQKYSSFQSSKMGRSDIIGLAYAWRKYHRLFRSIADSQSSRTIEVRYRDLCLETDDAINRLLDQLGLNRSTKPNQTGSVVSGTDQEIHKNIYRSPDLSRLDGWQSEFAPGAGRIVERILSEELERLDLAPYFSKLPTSLPRESVTLTQHGFAYCIAEMHHLLRRLTRKISRR